MKQNETETKRIRIKKKIIMDSSLSVILKPNEFVILSKIIDVHNELIKSNSIRYVNEPFELPLCDLMGMTWKINKSQIHKIVHRFCDKFIYILELPAIQILSVTYESKGKPSLYQFHMEGYKELVKQSKALKFTIERNNKKKYEKSYCEVFNDLIGRNVKRINKFNASASQ